MATPTSPDTHVTTARSTNRGQILAWSFWDWGSAGFNTVVVTFVFSKYLTSTVGENLHSPSAATRYAISVGVAGFFIAILAPVTGQRADAGGHRKRSLGIYSILVALSTLGLFFVQDSSGYFLLGAILIGLGSIFFEIGSVFYNSMLRQISTPATIGRVSGFGWSMGYFGGIILLLICYFGFVSGDGPTYGFLGISDANGLNIRLIALVATTWFVVSAIPVFFAVPEVPAGPAQRRVGFFASYKLLVRDIRQLVKTDPNLARFLLAQAIFRDGLAGIFHFGAIIAGTVYGFTSGGVLIFGAVANIAAAAGALVAGRFDDSIGPKRVIIISLVGLLVSGTVLMCLSGSGAFWIFGLILCLFVGPAQSAARTYLARLIPPGRESEIFGLYATTGRVVSFLSAVLFALFAGIFNADRAGIAGILLVLLVGLILVLPLAKPIDRSVEPTSVATP